MKKLRVTIEGKTYEVLVEFVEQDATTAPAVAAAAPAPAVPAVAAAPAPAPTPAPVVAPAPAEGGAAAPGTIVSPLAGKLVSIDVKLGQQVEDGAQVATIEAMKMNTYIYAPKDGRVEKIFANAGEAVEEGAPLLQIV
jgi:biotin carboxyl carrier protein